MRKFGFAAAFGEFDISRLKELQMRDQLSLDEAANRRALRRRAFATAAGLVALVLAPPAGASTLSLHERYAFDSGALVTYRDVDYSAAPGERNDLVVRETSDHGTIVFRDPGAVITVGPRSRFGLNGPGATWGCAGTVGDPHEAVCAYVPLFNPLLSPSQSESRDFPGFAAVYVATGDGNDRVNTVDGQAETVDCGAGTDRVRTDPHDLVAPNCLF